MMPYGQGRRLGESIDPRLMQADFSGYANAGMIQGQALANMGKQIGDVIKQRSDQKKRDAQNEKFLQQALDMFKGTDLEAPIGSAYQEYISEETTDKQRRAIGETMRETIGLGLKAQEMRMQQAALMAKGSAGAPKIETISDGKGGTYQAVWDAQMGQYRPISEFTGGFGQPGSQLGPQLPVDPQQIADAANMSVTGAASFDAGVLPPKGFQPGDSIGMPLPMPIQPSVDTDQQQASQILQSIMMGGDGQPQSQPMPVAQPTGIGYTPPEAPEQWSPPYRDPQSGRPVIRNLLTGEVKDYSKVGPMQINLGDNKLSDKRAMAQVDINTELYKQYTASAGKIPEMERLQQLVNEGVKTGSLAEFRVAAGKFFGKDVADLEEFQQLAGNSAMDMIQLTKGAVSDAEMNTFFNVLSPSINRSLEGNRRAVEFALDAARRADEQRKIILKMRKEKADPYEIQEALDAHREENKVDWEKRFGIGPQQYETAPGTSNILPSTPTQDLIQRSYGDFGR